MFDYHLELEGLSRLLKLRGFNFVWLIYYLSNNKVFNIADK